MLSESDDPGRAKFLETMAGYDRLIAECHQMCADAEALRESMHLNPVRREQQYLNEGAGI